MDQSSSNSVAPSTNPESDHSAALMTANLLAVFPDCMIMWDEKDLDGESTVTGRPDSQTDFQSTDGSAFSAATSGRRDSPRAAGAVPKPLSALSPMEGKSRLASVQYHIHYHPWNASRLMAAFLAGGAIALMVGFVFFRTYLPNAPDNTEPGQARASTERQRR